MRRQIRWPVWQPNANTTSKQLLKYEPVDWLDIFHIPVVYPIDEASYTNIPILSHFLSLCTILSTKRFKSHSRTFAISCVYVSVCSSFSDPMSSLFVFPVNIYLPFCVPYSLVPDFTIMGWASITLHYSTLCQDSYIVEPINVIHGLRRVTLVKASIFLSCSFSSYTTATPTHLPSKLSLNSSPGPGSFLSSPSSFIWFA